MPYWWSSWKSRSGFSSPSTFQKSIWLRFVPDSRMVPFSAISVNSVAKFFSYTSTVAFSVPTAPDRNRSTADTLSNTSNPRSDPPSPLCDSTSPKK